MNARNEKNPPRGGLFKPLVVEHLGLLVTASGGSSYRTLFQSSGIQSHSSSKIPPEPCYQWPLPVAHKSVSARLGIMSCRRVGCRGRPRRGIPHMAKRATAHHSLLRLASVGLCNSGTGKPTAPLKKREAACPKGRPNQQSSRTGCVSGARGR